MSGIWKLKTLFYGESFSRNESKLLFDTEDSRNGKMHLFRLVLCNLLANIPEVEESKNGRNAQASLQTQPHRSHPINLYHYGSIATHCIIILFIEISFGSALV